jgi:hypothetical protein
MEYLYHAQLGCAALFQAISKIDFTNGKRIKPAKQDPAAIVTLFPSSLSQKHLFLISTQRILS